MVKTAMRLFWVSLSRWGDFLITYFPEDTTGNEKMPPTWQLLPSTLAPPPTEHKACLSPHFIMVSRKEGFLTWVKTATES